MSDVIDWLLDGAPGAQRPPDVLDQLCRRLIESGFPLDRAAVFVHVLHPQYVAFSTIWLSDRPIEVRPAPYELATEDGFLRSPATLVMSSGESLRRDLTAPQAADDLPVLARLRTEGFTDYLIQPIRFTNGEVQAVSWATKRAGGFSDQDVARLAAINRPFARVIEIRALHRLCTTLLDTYVGHGSGERVLKGAIHPGDVQRIEAAILVSDIRGFTAFSNAHPPEQVIERLNAVFGCIMPAVDAEGGEVLKLIGDGLLAIFPMADLEPGAVCAAALRAADTATRAVAALDLTPPGRCGMALHVGEVSYGNIGAGNRLDFTAIGPAVNLVSRLEGLCRPLGRTVLASGAFAAEATTAMVPLGQHELRGIAEPCAVFGLAD